MINLPRQICSKTLKYMDRTAVNSRIQEEMSLADRNIIPYKTTFQTFKMDYLLFPYSRGLCKFKSRLLKS